MSMQIDAAPSPQKTLARSDARIEIIEQGSGPLVVMLAGVDRSAFDRSAATISQGGFRVLLLRSKAGVALNSAELAADAFAAIKSANKGAAVIVAEGRNTGAARRVALEHPEYVRGLTLASESADATARSNESVPAAATLYLIGERETNRKAAEQAQAEWGSRLTLIEIAGAGAAPLIEQPQRAAAVIVDWLRGPALSAEKTRIALPEESTLSAQQKALREQMLESLNSPAGRRVGALGPRAVLLHDPKLLQGYTAMGDVMAAAPVPLRYKELAILVTARAMDSDYEWAAHERAALNAGVPEAVIAAIKFGRAPNFEQAADRIVYDYADELHRVHKVSDATYKQAWDLLGTNGLINLTMVIGHYVNVAMTLNAHQMEKAAGSAPLPPRESR